MATPAENRARWTEIVERFRLSGMTKPAFAQQEKLSLKALENWHYRLRRSKAPQAIKGPRLRLVPVAVQPVRGAVARAAGEVVVDVQALQITVGPDADPALVAQLVAAIRKHAC